MLPMGFKGEGRVITQSKDLQELDRIFDVVPTFRLEAKSRSSKKMKQPNTRK